MKDLQYEVGDVLCCNRYTIHGSWDATLPSDFQRVAITLRYVEEDAIVNDFLLRYGSTHYKTFKRALDKHVTSSKLASSLLAEMSAKGVRRMKFIESDTFATMCDHTNYQVYQSLSSE